MKTHRIVSGSTYTFKLLCGSKGMDEERQNIVQHFGNALIKVNPLEHLHIGLKYLGPDSYDEKEMIFLKDTVIPIVEKYLPLEVAIDKLSAFYSTPEWECPPIVHLTTSSSEIRSLHKEIVVALQGQADTYVLAEGEYYTPHITMGVGKDEKEIRELIDSYELEPFTETLDTLAMRLPTVKNFIVHPRKYT